MKKLFVCVCLMLISLNALASERNDGITVYADDHGQPNACELISQRDVHKFKVWSSPEYNCGTGKKTDVYFITEGTVDSRGGTLVSRRIDIPFTVQEIKDAVFKHWLRKEANAVFWGSFTKIDQK